jgi:hypothetical protein
LEEAEEIIASRITEAARADTSVRIEDPQKLARMVVAIGQSLANSGRPGASKDELLDLANDFLERLF